MTGAFRHNSGVLLAVATLVTCGAGCAGRRVRPSWPPPAYEEPEAEAPDAGALDANPTAQAGGAAPDARAGPSS
ncbi:MAG: hypothetical protein ABTD50_19260 [Polyangiaceae bacterium]